MYTPFAPSFVECRDLFTRLSTEDGESEFSCQSSHEGAALEQLSKIIRLRNYSCAGRTLYARFDA